VVSHAAAQGFVRLLLDEGDAVRALAVQLQACHAAAGAQVDPIDRAHLEKLLGLLGVFHEEAPDTGKLTPREVRMLRLVADGLSNSELTAKLFISDSTVRTHLRNIYRKL